MYSCVSLFWIYPFLLWQFPYLSTSLFWLINPPGLGTITTAEMGANRGITEEKAEVTATRITMVITDMRGKIGTTREETGIIEAVIMQCTASTTANEARIMFFLRKD